jgi:thioredoxin-like negative regulator of GroEL
MHLKAIAKQHIETMFVFINAEKTPFFITKLQIQVLPTIIMFEDGVAVDRVIGFEDLGGEDEFETIVLTRRLVKSKIIDAHNKAEEGRIKIKKAKHAVADSDDDSDF